MGVFNKKALNAMRDRESSQPQYRILLVDDEPDTLETLAELLSREYEVVRAGDGNEALALIRENHPVTPFHLIISDQRMPGMSGVTLLNRSMNLLPDAKRIILSGFADVEAVIASVNEARIYEFMLKPVEGGKLLLTVKRALEAWELTQQNGRMVRELEAFNRTLQEKVSERTRILKYRDQEILRTQNQLIIQQKMASLGTLTAGIAHEIKNPLNFINSFSELNCELLEDLTRRLGSHTDESVQEMLKDLVFNAGAVQAHGNMADTIINNMLELAQGNMGAKQATDINNLVKEYAYLSYVGKRAADMGIEITFQFDEDLGQIPMVPQALGRVWLNLANNALEALMLKRVNGGPRYHPNLTVRTEDRGERVAVIIHDNGPGVEERIKERIFDPFFTTKPTGKGNIGLGLSICYDIVVMHHHGEIKLKSKIGDYTEFTILLPKT